MSPATPTSASQASPAAPPSGSAGLDLLPAGYELGQRYRIIGLLGKGGMGTVYRVLDRELNRDVALKLIRGDIASNPTVLERFKREIHLSSSVTHRNVLRVFDLGESGGLKFLTMQYVEGEDLATLLRREGRLPVPRLVALFRQICEGLAAAHHEGVIHRDLKPQNIMVDKADHVYLTDFGLARLQEQSHMTETGALLGTPSYMSPEQVKGEPLDARSDIYSLGVILYEMAAGEVPFTGGSVYEVMFRRLKTPPRPVAELNPDIPAYLTNILSRCMATDIKARYPTMREVLADLDSASFKTSLRFEIGRRRKWLVWASAFAVATAVSLGGVWLYQRRPAGPTAGAVPAAGKPRSVLIADFKNTTGDGVFDGTLEPALTVALEGASFITSYNRASARKLAAQLQPGAEGLDEAVARLVASREGVNVIVTGSVARRDTGYTLSVRALDGVTGKVLSAASTEVAGKENILASVTKVAASIRKALGDATPESEQLAQAETFTAASLEAAHAYAVAQDFQWNGKYDEAIRAYKQAIEQDPNLGRAYSGVATILGNIGQREEAEKYYKLALARIDRMSEREKYRTRAAYYLTITRDPDNAIEELSALVQKYPLDSAGHANLGLAYALKRDMVRATAEGKRAVEIYPRDVPRRHNLGLFAMYSGDFEGAVREQQAALELNPNFIDGYQGLALAQLGLGKVEEARATWKRAEALGPEGASVAATGLADMALYAGRAADARSLLEKAIEMDLAGKESERAAMKLVMLAEAHLLEAQPAKALAAAARALEADSGEIVQFGAARVFVEAGDAKRAAALAAQLETGLGLEPQMYGRLIRAEQQLKRGQAREALATFKEAQKLVDSWLVRFGLGRAYLEAGAFTEANAQLEQCLKRRGEMGDFFQSEIPTFRMLPPLYYYLGRTHEGLKSPDAAESLAAFVEIKKDGVDPLLADARKRLASR